MRAGGRTAGRCSRLCSSAPRAERESGSIGGKSLGTSSRPEFWTAKQTPIKRRLCPACALQAAWCHLPPRDLREWGIVQGSYLLLL